MVGKTYCSFALFRGTSAVNHQVDPFPGYYIGCDYHNVISITVLAGAFMPLFRPFTRFVFFHKLSTNI